MNEPNLVRVHEAWVAHHVAAIGQVDRKNRTAAVLNRARAMVMQLFVVVGLDVSTGEHRLDMRKELRVDRHHVFKTTVDWTILDHPNLAVAFDNLCFDLTDLLVDE